MKYTKRDALNELLSIPEVANREVLVEFINKELSGLEKRRTTVSDKDKAKIAEDTNMKEAILDFLADKDTEQLFRISDFIKEIDIFREALTSNQRVTYLVSSLVKDGTVRRVEKGKNVYFAVVK